MLAKAIEKQTSKAEKARVRDKKKALAFLSDVFNFLNKNPDALACATRGSVNFLYDEGGVIYDSFIVSYQDFYGSWQEKSLLSPLKRLGNVFNGTSYGFSDISNATNIVSTFSSDDTAYQDLDSYKKLRSSLKHEGYTITCRKYHKDDFWRPGVTIYIRKASHHSLNK